MKSMYVKIFLIVILMVGCQERLGLESEKQGETDKNVALSIVSIGNTSYENYVIKGEKMTALELLKQKHDVKVNLGNYIECIDDTCVNKEYSWAFYLNGRLSSEGVSFYRLKDNDAISLIFSDKME